MLMLMLRGSIRSLAEPDRASLMGIDDIVWDETAAQLPLRDHAALAAKCR